MARAFFEFGVLGGTMPLFANERALIESAAPKNNQSNQLENRPRLTARSRDETRSAQLAQPNRSTGDDGVPDSTGFDGFTTGEGLDEARMSAVIAKQLIMTNALESLFAQAHRLDLDSLRLLD